MRPLNELEQDAPPNLADIVEQHASLRLLDEIGRLRERLANAHLVIVTLCLALFALTWAVAVLA